MSRLLILLLCLCTFSLQAADAPTSKVDLKEVENAITQVEGDGNLEEADREKLLASLRRTRSFLKSANDFRERSRGYVEARENAAAEATALHAELEEKTAQEPAAVSNTISLAELEGSIQHDKAELAAAEATLTEVNNQLQIETNRTNDIRTDQAELKKDQAELAARAKQAGPASDSTSEKARKWQFQAEAESLSAEIKMLDEEILSQPMRLQLLKAQQDSGTHRRDALQARVKASELLAIELRKGEAEKALSEAESAEQPRPHFDAESTSPHSSRSRST